MCIQKTFDEIIQLFNLKSWDISWFSISELSEIENHPIKINIQNNINLNNIQIFLLLCKNTKNYDYALDTEAKNILKQINIQADTYWCNYKYAEILCGLGQWSKNSLVYNYKFGFEHHITVLAIYNNIVNLPVRKTANFNLMPFCSNCQNCIKACPIQAIYKKDNQYLVNYKLCDDFCGYNNHPIIPALKDNYYKYSDYQIPNFVLKEITTFEDSIKKIGQPVDFFIKKNNKFYLASFPVCRECASQRKCSKYGGHYPYDQQQTFIYEVEKT